MNVLAGLVYSPATVVPSPPSKYGSEGKHYLYSLCGLVSVVHTALNLRASSEGPF